MPGITVFIGYVPRGTLLIYWRTDIRIVLFFFCENIQGNSNFREVESLLKGEPLSRVGWLRF